MARLLFVLVSVLPSSQAAADVFGSCRHRGPLILLFPLHGFAMTYSTGGGEQARNCNIPVGHDRCTRPPISIPNGNIFSGGMQVLPIDYGAL